MLVVEGVLRTNRLEHPGSRLEDESLPHRGELLFVLGHSDDRSDAVLAERVRALAVLREVGPFFLRSSGPSRNPTSASTTFRISERPEERERRP